MWLASDIALCLQNELIKTKLFIEEINLIPEDKRQELYELIHNFRMGLNQTKHKINEITQFADS